MVEEVEMEKTKKQQEFTRLSDSIVRLITQKHEEIEVKAKQLLELKEEEFELKNKELVDRSTLLESVREKLALSEKRFEEKWRELEIHAIEIEEDRDRASKQLRELEMKDLGFKQREEEIELRGKDIEWKRKELDRILEQFGTDKKKLEERIREIERKEKQMEGRINGLDILSKDLERQSRELDSSRKKSAERMHKLDQKERQLDEKVQLFESSKRRLDEDWKKLDSRVREVNCRERELDRGLEQLKLKEESLDMKSKEIELKRNKSDNLCKEIVMDGKTLQIYLNEYWQNHEEMGGEVSFLLGLSQDPAKLVLDALQGFYPPHLMKNGNGEEFSGHIVHKSCILLLEQLLKISRDIKIKPEVKNEAGRLSCVWITKLKPDSEHPMEILGFLLVLAIYDVVSIFSADEIFDYVKTVAHFEYVPELCCLLGMTDKISGLIQDLVERKQHLVAIRYAYNYNLIEKFPLGSLLKDHVETSKIESAAIIETGNNSLVAQSRARTRTISDLTAAIMCIEKYNISSEYSPANLRQMIGSLYKHDKREAGFHAPASAVAEAPLLQQTDTGCSVPVSSIEPKAVVSTEDPLPKRRKLLDGKSISTDIPEPEKQVCGSEKDLGVLLHQNLDFCSMRVKVVGILQSSANPASLVLDAMRLCFLPICGGGASEEIPMKWCISLLKELRGYTIEQCSGDEARMLSKKLLKDEKSCDPMEIACVLLFRDVYQTGFAIKPAKVVSLINSLYCPKQLQELFGQIGLPEFLPDMIKRWIGSNHQLQAVKCISALQLGGKFPLVQLINEHLDNWNKLADERYKKEPNSLQEINERLQGLNAVDELVRDCMLESVYPIKQLEDSRNELIRRKERIRKASTLRQEQQQQKQKKTLKRRLRRKKAHEEQLRCTSQVDGGVGTSSNEPPVSHLQGVGFYQPAPLPPNHFNNQQQCGSYADASGKFPNQGFIR